MERKLLKKQLRVWRMKKHVRIILSIMISIMVIFSNASSTVSLADGCNHVYDAHWNTGAGYVGGTETHVHLILYIDDTTIVYSCTKTKYVYYCQYQCIYCHALYPNSHEHAYWIHSYDNSRENIY